MKTLLWLQRHVARLCRTTRLIQTIPQTLRKSVAYADELRSPASHRLI